MTRQKPRASAAGSRPRTPTARPTRGSRARLPDGELDRGEARRAARALRWRTRRRPSRARPRPTTRGPRCGATSAAPTAPADGARAQLQQRGDEEDAVSAGRSVRAAIPAACAIGAQVRRVAALRAEAPTSAARPARRRRMIAIVPGQRAACRRAARSGRARTSARALRPPRPSPPMIARKVHVVSEDVGNQITAEGLAALEAEILELETEGRLQMADAAAHRARLGRPQGERRVPRRQGGAGASRDEDPAAPGDAPQRGRRRAGRGRRGGRRSASR